MDNSNIRGKNMPRRKKKFIRPNSSSIKKTELGEKYNKIINLINNIIIQLYNNNDDLYIICKNHILDKLEEFGGSIDSYDLLKKSIFSFKNDIKDDRLEFPIFILLENYEHPYQFKTNIYDSIFVKNFEQEWLSEIPFQIINELYTLLDNITT